MSKLLTWVVLALMPVVARGEGYLCVADMATGFSYNDGAWRSGGLKASEKYLVHRSDASGAIGIKAAKWYVSEFGSKSAAAVCYDDFDKSGNLFCKQQDRFDVDYVDFRMNKNSLRFLYAYLAGYWDREAGTEAGDTPYLAIGRCSPM